MVSTSARLVLAMVFAAAGVSKLASLGAFESQAVEFVAVRGAAVRVAARLLPAAELACAALLMLGVQVEPTATVMLCLLLLFTVLAARNLLRGRHVPCACFGSSGRHEFVGVATLVRNGALIGLAVDVICVGLANGGGPQSPVWSGPLATGASIAPFVACCAVISVYAVVAQAFRLNAALEASR